MQIHEITRPTLQEGVLGSLASGLTGLDIPQSQASVTRSAAASAEKLQAQGAGQSQPLPTVQQAVAGVQKNPAQQQFIKGLVAQWQQQAPKVSLTKESKRRSKSKTTTDSNWRQDALRSVGATFAQARPKPGQMPASVAASKQGQLMLKAYGKPRGGIQDIDEAPQEYTTPGGIIVPGATKTDTKSVSSASVTPIAKNQYQDAFEKWAAEKLLTREPETRQMISLDDVKKTDIKDELDRALAQVVATARDAQKNAVAVNNYLTIAVAGVARRSQELRQSSDRGGSVAAKISGTPGGAIVTQQELRNKLNQEAGINVNQVEALKKIAQDPAARQALLKSLGIQA